MVGENYSTLIDRGTSKRIPELLLMILTSVPLGILINQLTGILDSIGRNEFVYDPRYLVLVIILFTITLILFGVLIEHIRHVRIIAIVQVLIDTTNGEIPYIEFKNHKGDCFNFKPQMHLANAFQMMNISLQMTATLEKHGEQVWTDPSIPFEKSERAERIRKKIIDSYADTFNLKDTPVYELFDRALNDYLQNAMYMADNLGIQETEYFITHEWRDGKMGGFKAEPATEIEPKTLHTEKYPSPIIEIEPLFVSDSDSRSTRVRIPKGMKIIDISSDECRGFSIAGNGIDLEVRYEIIRQIPMNDLDLITSRETGVPKARLVAEQLELTTHLKMTILGFLRNRKLFNRLIRWAEEYILNMTSEFDWPTFKARNKIVQFERVDLEAKRKEMESNIRDWFHSHK